MTAKTARFTLTPEKDRDYTRRPKNVRIKLWVWRDAARKAESQGRPVAGVLDALLEGWVRGDIDV